MFISHAVTAAEDLPSFVAQFNVSFIQSEDDQTALHVFTDGSKMVSGSAGYSVIGYYLGRIVFSLSVKLSRNTSSHDAEMFALAHAASRIHRFVTLRPTISMVHLHSDSTSSLQSIFCADPHPAQAASIQFRQHFHALLTALPSLRVKVDWVPGHKGVIGMKEVDKRAKQAAKRKNGATLLDFTSRLAALSEIKKLPLREWRKIHDAREDRESSGFYQASQSLRPELNLKSRAETFLMAPRPVYSRIVQMATGHGYFGEYFKRFVPSNPTLCTCHEISGAPPTLHTRDHILRSCPYFERDRHSLSLFFPRLSNPRWSFGNLFRRDNLPVLANWLSRTDTFSKAGIPHRQREPP